MKFRESTKLHRKSGVWGTRRLLQGWSQRRARSTVNLLPASRLLDTGAAKKLGNNLCRSGGAQLVAIQCEQSGDSLRIPLRLCYFARMTRLCWHGRSWPSSPCDSAR
jgi:hypothetical protein